MIGGSTQQILRRLQGLFHAGYLDRPRFQLRYFSETGSRPIVYELGSEGRRLLAARPPMPRPSLVNDSMPLRGKR